MIEKGLGGDWETLRRYLPSKASRGGLGTRAASIQRRSQWQRPEAGLAPPAGRQGPGSDLELI